MCLRHSGRVSVSHTGDSGFEPSNLFKIIFLSLNSANCCVTFELVTMYSTRRVNRKKHQRSNDVACMSTETIHYWCSRERSKRECIVCIRAKLSIIQAPYQQTSNHIPRRSYLHYIAPIRSYLTLIWDLSVTTDIWSWYNLPSDPSNLH